MYTTQGPASTVSASAVVGKEGFEAKTVSEAKTASLSLVDRALST
jgi:hypothetical protein